MEDTQIEHPHYVAPDEQPAWPQYAADFQQEQPLPCGKAMWCIIANATPQFIPGSQIENIVTDLAPTDRPIEEIAFNGAMPVWRPAVSAAQTLH